MFVKIKKKCLSEIRRRSQDYLRKIRGKNFSSLDFEIAESLTGIGYDIAYDLFLKKKFEKQKRNNEKKSLRKKIIRDRRVKELLFG
ncbi:MAG TPA: hypothetical protein VFF33_08130 [Ignavibacteriaceae bacterium]|nr:hypothetical protein [Ignavibacteriaceae bacterium]